MTPLDPLAAAMEQENFLHFQASFLFKNVILECVLPFKDFSFFYSSFSFGSNIQ